MTAPEPYFTDGQVTLHLGDCLDVLAALPDSSVDAIVTDPPYGLEFMGREWDTFRPSNARIRERVDGRTNPAVGKSVTRTPEAYVAGEAFGDWCEAWARECLRVLKPGGYLAAFGGTRTYHWLACGIEKAGFEIRDSLHWLYGGGFPKGKACLKPAHEPIVLARKRALRSVPLPGLDACRVAFAGAADLAEAEGKNRHADFGSGARENRILGDMGQHSRAEEGNYDGSAGRWPPNVLLGEEAAAELDRQSGASVSRRGGLSTKALGVMNDDSWQARDVPRTGHDDAGGASRFFPVFRYEAKADASERPRLADGTAHPTVKPLGLMRWLVRLVTPPGGLVLDPFAGSGTTGEACIVEGFNCILGEKDPTSAELIKARLSKPIQPVLFGEAS